MAHPPAAADLVPAPQRPRLLVARRVPSAVAARAMRDYDAILSEHDLTAEETISAASAQASEAILAGPKVRLQREHMALLPASLKILANPSAGVDHIDVAAAKEHGLLVTNAPDGLTDCTADLTLLLILAACRRAGPNAKLMAQGWRRNFGMAENLGKRVSGAHLGIVGMGRIGRAVAHRARSFGMTIHYFSRTRLAPELESDAIYHPSLQALLPACDIISLHVPGGTGTLMTAQMFAVMRKGAVFVNAGRGSLVDEEALIDALTSGHLFGAGLDVFRSEPDFDLRLRDLPNVFLSPHAGSATVETRNRMGFDALDNIDAVLAGRPPLNPV